MRQAYNQRQIPTISDVIGDSMIQENSCSTIGSITGQQAKGIGIEYGNLISADCPSEQEEARITEILELTLSNDEVEFWVSHITLIKGMDLGLLTESACKEYEDQKALLRERLGSELPCLRGVVASTVTDQLKEQTELCNMKAILAAAMYQDNQSDSRRDLTEE